MHSAAGSQKFLLIFYKVNVPAEHFSEGGGAGDRRGGETAPTSRELEGAEREGKAQTGGGVSVWGREATRKALCR